MHVSYTFKHGSLKTLNQMIVDYFQYCLVVIQMMYYRLPNKRTRYVYWFQVIFLGGTLLLGGGTFIKFFGFDIFCSYLSPLLQFSFMK